MSSEETKRRQQPREKARAAREQDREQQHDEIQLNFGETRQPNWSLAQEQIQGRLCERNAEGASDRCEQKVFSEGIPGQPPFGGAQRRAHGVFAVAREAASKLRVGQV